MGQTAGAGAEGGPPADPEGLGLEAGVDPELLSLPAPPRGKRLATLTLMALVAATSLGLLTSLRADLQYFFSSPTATDLGEAVAIDPAALNPDTYVRVHGTPMASHAVRYARTWDGDYAVFPLAGQRHVFVRVALDTLDGFHVSTRREFAGRLVTMGELGAGFAAVRGYFGDRMGVPVSSETFVVLADQPPGRYAGSLLLAALCILFILVDVALMVRWFRPITSHR